MNKQEDALAHCRAGLDYLGARRVLEAKQEFESAVAVDPGFASGHHNLGYTLDLLKEREAALRHYKIALTLDPSVPIVYFRLGRLLLGMGRSSEALPYLETACELDPDRSEPSYFLGVALGDLGRPEAACQALNRSIEIQPLQPMAHYLLGRRQQELGDFRSAAASFRGAIELDPSFARARFSLASIKRFKPEDRPMMEEMQALLHVEATPLEALRDLHYALGKAHDDLHEYEEAMKHFDDANKLALETLPPEALFDPEKHRALLESIKDAFPKSLFDQVQAGHSNSELPLLIVGLPRSGTTLLEQVLSCHPEIAAGKEFSFWRDTMRARRTPGLLSSKDAEQVAEGYIRLLRSEDAKAARIIDKAPLNFLALGMVHRVFPKARIIHCRRHAVDNCISLYTTLFSGTPPEYSHSKEDLVTFYRGYQSLMDYWREVLPAECLTELAYEDLVLRTEETVKRLLEFIGLAWDEACLHPENNPRTVHTPSSWQVRQPVHTGSVGRWRNYALWLGPLEELLSEEDRASLR